MAYSKSPRPYRRYSVLMRNGKMYVNVRAHNLAHAMKLAAMRAARENLSRAELKQGWRTRGDEIHEVFEGTVRRATS